MGKVTFTATFEDGESKSVTATIYDTITAAATIKPNNYDKSYGIDWCEMKDDLTAIEKFQETAVSDISHVLDETTTQFKTAPTQQDKQDILYKLYETEEYLGKQIPTTWINLLKDKTAVVDVLIYLKKDLDIDKEKYITFEHDATKFTVAYDGKENEAIQLNRLDKAKGDKKEYTGIKIKALQTFNSTEYILLKTEEGKEVGKIEMSPNNTVNLGVKIIPIVFNEATKKADAIALHNSALNGGNLKKILNNESLNQAGVICNIAPLNVVDPECIVVDVSKDNWNQFYVNNIFQDWIFKDTVIKPDPSIDDDGSNQYYDKDINPKFLVDKLKEVYFNKYGRTHKGAIVFVTDQSYNKPNWQAYSLTDPIRNQGVVVFKKGLSKPSVYAHELGHMLGLEHSFLENDDDFSNTNDKLEDLTHNKSVTKSKQEIQGNINYSQDNISKSLKEINNTKDKGLIDRNKQFIEDDKLNIEKYKDDLHKIDIYTTLANFKVTEGKTKNYMDYISNRAYFNSYQVRTLKSEVIKFYN